MLSYEESMKLVEQTKSDVNDVRTACGFPPLKRLRPGRIGISCDCPIANSLKEVFESKGEVPEIDGETINVPADYASVLTHFNWASIDKITDDYYQEEYIDSISIYKESFGHFIQAFDEGELPKLDTDKGAIAVE